MDPWLYEEQGGQNTILCWPGCMNSLLGLTFLYISHFNIIASLQIALAKGVAKYFSRMLSSKCPAFF
jgi:hypothetical protein